MKLATKTRILIALLVTSFAWPPVHFFVVRALGINPWNYWGWAMYCVPPPRVAANPYSTDDGRLLSMQGLPRDQALRLKRAYDAFSYARMEYGPLRRPDDFARALFAEFPDVGGVRIDVQHVVLERASGMVGARSDPAWIYTYRRSELFD